MKLQQCIVEIVSYMLVTKATKAWIPFFIYRFATRNHPCNVLSIWAWLPDAGCSSRILLSTRYGNLRIRAVVSILKPSVVFSETREVPKELWTRLLNCFWLYGWFRIWTVWQNEWRMEKEILYIFVLESAFRTWTCLIFMFYLSSFNEIFFKGCNWCPFSKNMQFSYVTNCYLAKYAILTSIALPCSQ